jgi:hypothetical protein
VTPIRVRQDTAALKYDQRWTSVSNSLEKYVIAGLFFTSTSNEQNARTNLRAQQVKHRCAADGTKEDKESIPQIKARVCFGADGFYGFFSVIIVAVQFSTQSLRFGTILRSFPSKKGVKIINVNMRLP